MDFAERPLLAVSGSSRPVTRGGIAPEAWRRRRGKQLYIELAHTRSGNSACRQGCMPRLQRGQPVGRR